MVVRSGNGGTVHGKRLSRRELFGNSPGSSHTLRSVPRR